MRTTKEIQAEFDRLQSLINQQQALLAEYNTAWYHENIEPHKHLLGPDGEMTYAWMQAVTYPNYLYFLTFANIKS